MSAHAPESMNAATETEAVSLREMWLISLGHMLTHWYPATFYLLLPLIGRELGLSYTEIGFTMTAMHGVGALMSMPGGMLVDIVGRKGTLMAISLFWIEPLAGRHIGVRDTRDRRHATHSWFTVDENRARTTLTLRSASIFD